MIFFAELFNIEVKRVIFARSLPDYRREHRIALQIDTRSWLPPSSRQVPKMAPSPATVQDVPAPRQGRALRGEIVKTLLVK